MKRTLAAEVANILSTRLDRDKPLWRLQVIHGLPGRTAVVMTLHHAAVDGIAASEIFAAMLDGPAGHVVGTQQRSTPTPFPARRLWRRAVLHPFPRGGSARCARPPARWRIWTKSQS